MSEILLSDLKIQKKAVDRSKLTLTPQPRTARKCERLKQPQRQTANDTQAIEILDETPPKINRNIINEPRNLRSSAKKLIEPEVSIKKSRGRPKKASAAKLKDEPTATPAPLNTRTGRIPKREPFKRKQMPASQKRIDNFFQSCTKTSGVEPSTSSKLASKSAPAKLRKIEPAVGKSKQLAPGQKTGGRGRKRLFVTKNEPTPLTVLDSEVINLCDLSDTEEEQAKLENANSITTKLNHMSDSPRESEKENPSRADGVPDYDEILCAEEVHDVKAAKPCPPYKVIKGTTFAVDAFRYGHIENVTHYFLTHYHADHYVGLTKKFSMPLYLSPLTARLVREFIGVDEMFLHEIELNEPVVVNGVQITAIDAHHCPGAVMFIFKLPTGECILHTGDFRACSQMESEPVFWNNDIHTIYLDTTYLPTKYAFCTQYESIDRAKYITREFMRRHIGKRILYVCGSYLIGKEKFWSSLAHEFNFKVWCEENRYKAISAMQLDELQQLKWVRDDENADMHIIPMMKLSYPVLQAYFNSFHGKYDVMLAFRPSGWEKNSKPRFNGTINLVGIEYSEHSSYNELERFVKYLKPRKVISTVPVGRDLFETGVVPTRWYQYDKLTGRAYNFQSGISSYLTPMKPASSIIKKSGLKLANFEPLDEEKCSPSKSTPMRCVGNSAEKHRNMEEETHNWS